MIDFEYAKFLERQYFRTEINQWNKEAKALIKSANREGKKMLLREARELSLKTFEEAARTEEEFKRVEIRWEKRDRRKRDSLAKHFVSGVNIYDNAPDIIQNQSEIFPNPLGEYFWWQLIKGDFIDYIHDCPYEISELTSYKPISDFIDELDEDDKELLYLRAIRYWSPQKLAEKRGQTDRNIRKIYDVMITSLRRKLYFQLLPSYQKNIPLTPEQKMFVEEYLPVFGTDKIRRRKKRTNNNEE